MGGEGLAPTAAGRKEAKRGSASGTTSGKPRGFELLSPERRREIARIGGKSVAPVNRALSKDRDLAAAAGRVGGQPPRRCRRAS
ncbi:MAG: stress-induced protein [Phenylobacterium sp.]|nr:stress-induced protein [Phenylobacterium sp.]